MSVLFNERLGFMYVDTPLSIPGIQNSLIRYVKDTGRIDDIPVSPCRSIDLVYHPKYGELFKDYWTFGVIRNPFDYVIALYEYFINGPSDNVAWHKSIELERDALREQMRLASRGFRKFLLEDKDYEYLHSRPFCGDKFLQQTMWLSECEDIFSFENITPLLNKLFKKGGGTLPSYSDGDAPTPHELKEKRKRYFSQQKDLVDLVVSKYPEDFQIGKYPLEPV